MKNNILLVGGAGYIGSHMGKLLIEQGYDLIVLDDLSGGFADAISGGKLYVGNVGDAKILDDIFDNHNISSVFHFASFIQVAESSVNPAKYYENNLSRTITLLNTMSRHNVKRFIFSSTAAIFGTPITDTIDESHPQLPINPYGRSKWMVENLLSDYELAYGMKSVCLRYFNAAGAHPDGSLGERHMPETHLIPLAISAALGRGPKLKLFGNDYPTEDGTCIRDYIHVCDLVDAHLLALRYLEAGGCSLKVNLGNGSGYSVRQIIGIVGDIMGCDVPYELEPRRLGDPEKLVANSQLAKKILHWSPCYPNVEDIILHAVRWHSSHK